MSNWIDMQLDVLASSPDQINKIEATLQQPCEELLTLVAKNWDEDAKEIAENVKALVALKPTRNLGHIDPSANKARRFENEWKDKFSDILWSHVYFVSQEFPEAIFLASYWDTSTSCAGKRVILGNHSKAAIDNHFKTGHRETA
jgi:hypothetical protein